MFEETLLCTGRVRIKPDTGWLLSQGAKILTMQGGFGLLEASFTRKMHAANIMMKNVTDLTIGALVYWFVGYSISFAGDQVPGDWSFWGGIGDKVEGPESFDFAFWFFQFSFASTCSTIDSGAVAERVNFHAYIILSSICTGFMYPVAAHWVWGYGWLSDFGFVDFAGSAVCHLLGAASAITCCLFVGPRIGRFQNYKTWQWKWTRALFREEKSSLYYQGPLTPVEMRSYVEIQPLTNPVQMLFGTLLLWMAWYAFNGGSTQGLTSDRDIQAAKICCTTTMGAASGGLTAIVFSMRSMWRAHQKLAVQVPDLSLGILAGLVSVTGGAPWFMPLEACLIAIFGTILAFLSANQLERWQIDDVVGAIPVHGVCGIWGTLAIALFSHPDCASEAASQNVPKGLFAGNSAEEGLHFLFIQVVGVTCILLWGILVSFTSVFVLDMIGDYTGLHGLKLRCARWNEIVGLDLAEHWYDDNFDYQEQAVCEEMEQVATSPPYVNLLWRLDHSAGDPSFEHEIVNEIIAEEAEKQPPTQTLETVKAELDMASEKITQLKQEMERRLKCLENGYRRRFDRLELEQGRLREAIGQQVGKGSIDFTASGKQLENWIRQVIHIEAQKAWKADTFGGSGMSRMKSHHATWRTGVQCKPLCQEAGNRTEDPFPESISCDDESSEKAKEMPKFPEKLFQDICLQGAHSLRAALNTKTDTSIPQTEVEVENACVHVQKRWRGHVTRRAVAENDDGRSSSTATTSGLPNVCERDFHQGGGQGRDMGMTWRAPVCCSPNNAKLARAVGVAYFRKARSGLQTVKEFDSKAPEKPTSTVDQSRINQSKTEAFHSSQKYNSSQKSDRRKRGKQNSAEAGADL
eukprot:gnl/MRDRNA2_/MRDRNA2_35629_c0_seq1.p1 gnl/MRDRNA2_/MRDRNA2_35629_c0~~gnl/MRDRNA2_/MRDRNA2_35629_c0_seq1.p1  ORF type:complete len:860 (-),score=155.21 gnl/MRDRNA2_/MRDRNA2_35629_c0_seq1:70-2649(-)